MSLPPFDDPIFVTRPLLPPLAEVVSRLEEVWASRWLTNAGHKIHGYLLGNELLMQVRRESFDLFVLDWEVPDISGVEVLRWIRANISKSVPILFVTVRDTEEDIVHALNAGADDYMIKPVRQSETLARLGALLRRAYPQK